jgi:branched-chain amino acid transport system permease protein
VLFLQLVIGGLAIGGLYVLVAVGFSVVWRTTGVFNIAQGAAIGIGGTVYTGFYKDSPLLAVVAALVACCAFGVASYELIYRNVARWRNQFEMLFAASLALSIVAEAVLTLAYGSNFVTPNTAWLAGYVAMGSFRIPTIDLVGLAIAVVAFGALLWTMYRTGVGRHIRAVSSNAGIAEVWGINRRRVEQSAFVVGSILAAATGIVLTYLGGSYPNMGDVSMLIAVAATVGGGVGSIVGTALAALAFGLIESVSLFYVNSTWQDPIVFGVFLLIILIRPRGLVRE